MSSATIDRLIINSPYEEPGRHWKYSRERRAFDLAKGRRPAGYIIPSESSQSFDDPGVFVEIPLVNQIRPRVNAWREEKYPGVTGITRRLLEHWTNEEEFENRRFFFCQLEAVETLIWLTEAPEAERVGLEIGSDGSAFQRLCAKMATGSGKTVVMAMVIAWQVLNKVTYPLDPRFSKHIFIVAPGLTVRNRLAVLGTSHPESYYKEFHVVPPALNDKLRQGKVVIRNWHALNWESDEKLAKKRSVDKRGAKSDEAYVREVLQEIARFRNILVINDEAHHAWRVPTGAKATKSEIEEATKWIGGLDRIHETRGILKCYDFSATPYISTGGRGSEEALFDWIVSDFGLSDAIEAGLVKTPRVVVRDDGKLDAKSYKSRLYHIYRDPEVKDDLNRKAKPEEPLPDLVTNGYNLLGYDWQETLKSWRKGKAPTPPVMITVANRTETAARVKYAFDHRKIRIEKLCDPEKTLHIDSRVLGAAEAAEEPIAELDFGESGQSDDADEPRGLTQKQKSELLRQQVDTVGKPNSEGAHIQNVISVGMLSEGWDAKTVTHIMGLRAFTSQLLCEQVIGRGLRRTSYEVDPKTGLFDPEYVNVFGIPFTFLPHEGEKSRVPGPSKVKTRIEPAKEKAEFSISWPNIIRIEHSYRPKLSLNWEKLSPLKLDASQTPSLAQLAPFVDGKPHWSKIKTIDLKTLAEKYRTQKIVFETARDVYAQMHKNWKGGEVLLLAQLVRLIEQFIASDRIRITPALFQRNETRRRLMVTLNMSRVAQHIQEAIRFENAEGLELIFDQDQPIRSTGDTGAWYTGKPCGPTERSHINFCVYDSTWEASEAFVFDTSPGVSAWVKNDHLGFEVFYLYRGVVRKYRPDFLVRLKTGDMLIIEVKGQDSDQDRTKRRFLQEWVKAVNEDGRFGRWHSDVSMRPGEIHDILERYAEKSDA